MGWGGIITSWVLAAAFPMFLPLTHLRPHSTWHRLQMRGGGVGWGGVGWDNNVLAAAFLPLTLAATLNMASSPDAGGFLTRQACI